MSILLTRATEKVSNLRVDIAMVDLQVECLYAIVKQKDEEITALENEISILQAKLRGIKKIRLLNYEELEKRMAALGELQAKKVTRIGAEPDPKTLQ